MSINPYADLSASISPAVMQTYVVVMIVLVAGGTLFDVWHKRSARYFFDNWRRAKGRGTRPVGGVRLDDVRRCRWRLLRWPGLDGGNRGR